MEIAISVAAKIAEYTVVLVLTPILRPLRPYWGYDDNFQALLQKAGQLNERNAEIQASIRNGASVPQEFKDWQERVTHISNATVPELGRERQNGSRTTGGCFCCCNVSANHMKSVAKTLKEAEGLAEEAAGSGHYWKWLIQRENAKRIDEEVKEKMAGVRREIGAGEVALKAVQDWIEEACAYLDDVSSSLDRKASVGEALLQRADGFVEFSRESDESRYEVRYREVGDLVKELELKERSVRYRIEAGHEPLPDVKDWQERVMKNAHEVAMLSGDYCPEEHAKLDHLSKEVRRLLEQEDKFKQVSRPCPPQGTIQSELVGGEGGHIWDFGFSKDAAINSILISSDEIINAVTFTVIDRKTKQVIGTEKFGGDGGYTSRIDIDWPEEKLTMISGTTGFGPYYLVTADGPKDIRLITSLVFHTNKRKCGPYGNGQGTFFKIPTEGEIVGFFGRAGMCIDAIGVYSYVW